MTNCVNCGAPLSGSKCQYCGTEYNGSTVYADFSEDDWTGTLSVGGKEYPVYISEINVDFDAIEGRRMDGTLLDLGLRIHKFTLIEL